MRQILDPLRQTVSNGFFATFGGAIKPQTFIGNENIFWGLAALQVTVYGVISAIYYMTESFSYYIDYTNLAASIFFLTILPLIGFLGRFIWRSEESPYLLPVIYLSINIPVTLLEAMVWVFGTYFISSFPNDMTFWNNSVIFIKLVLIFRACLMNERVTNQSEQMRMLMTVLCCVIFFSKISDYTDYDPLYVHARYVNTGEQTYLSDEEIFGTQPALLQKKLDAVKPSQPGHSDVFLITYGGDGYQRVFEREAHFAQKQFDQVLNTAGRSIALINHPATLKTDPLATITNLKEALSGFKQKAQGGEDILVFYVASHGGRDGQITTDYPRTSMMRVDAQGIAKALKQSGFRWKIVIVSACYSGSFIPIMKDDDTLIITAASAQKTSFGCADDANLTYFGQAFLRDALPHSKTLQAAYEKARDLIAVREEQEKLIPSEPQISMGKAIAIKLEKLKLRQEN